MDNPPATKMADEVPIKMAPTKNVVNPPTIAKTPSTQDLPKISDNIERDATEPAQQDIVGQSASQESLTVVAEDTKNEDSPTNVKGKKRSSRLHMTCRRIFNSIVSFCTCCKGCRGSYETVPSQVRKQSFTEVQESVNKDDASAEGQPEIDKP